MKTIKTSPVLKDGGSIQEIVTDKGTFSLVKKLNGKNNGYYGAKGKVDDSVAYKLENALSRFFAAKKKDNITELEIAIKTVQTALQNDESYRQGWVANIAMAFFDCYKTHTEDFHVREIYPDDSDILTISNKAAENFINLLCQ